MRDMSFTYFIVEPNHYEQLSLPLLNAHSKELFATNVRMTLGLN